MNWTEFKKGKKKEKIKAVFLDLRKDEYIIKEIEGYRFELSTFIIKEKGLNKYSILDSMSCMTVGSFPNFNDLLFRWNYDIKDRFLKFRKTKKYDKLIEDVKSLEERK